MNLMIYVARNFNEYVEKVSSLILKDSDQVSRSIDVQKQFHENLHHNDEVARQWNAFFLVLRNLR